MLKFAVKVRKRGAHSSVKSTVFLRLRKEGTDRIGKPLEYMIELNLRQKIGRIGHGYQSKQN